MNTAKVWRILTALAQLALLREAIRLHDKVDIGLAVLALACVAAHWALDRWETRRAAGVP